MFPGLIKLDEQELPDIVMILGTEDNMSSCEDEQELPEPVLLLEMEDTVSSSEGISLPGEDVKVLMVQFIEQYYIAFDSNDRQPLVGAYHDQAVFSLSASKMCKVWLLEEYIPGSRNPLQIPLDNDQRDMLLRKGSSNIVSSLSRLPQTRHDPASFRIDVSLVTPTLMSLAISGIFKEVTKDEHNAPIRSFSRTFTVMPQGQGFCIVNDVMHVTNATDDQENCCRMVTPVPTPSNEVITDEQRQQMIVEFCNWSGMNFEFSEKCLREHQWNKEKAAIAFQTLNERGVIPMEAFLAT